MAEAMPQLVWTAEPDGTIDYLNGRWIDYTGVDLDALRRSPENTGAIHPDDRGEAWRLWRVALQTGEPYEHEYRIRRDSDGSYRWFLGRAVSIRADDGTILRWIGTATDVDDLRRARDHLRFIVEAGNSILASLDVEQICRELARVAVQYVADWCFVTLAEDGEYRTCAVEHKDEGLRRHIEEYRDRYPPDRTSRLARVVTHNEPLLIERVQPEQLQAAAKDADHLRLMNLLKMHSVMIVPLANPDGAVYGAVTFVSSESRRTFTKSDAAVAGTVAGRAGLAIQNAQIFQKQRRAAEALRFTGQVNQLLFETSDPWQAMERVAQLIATEVADACEIVRLHDETVRTEILVHRDPKINADIAPLRGHRTLRLQPERELVSRLKRHETVVLTEDSERPKERSWPYLGQAIDALNARSTVVVPWHAGGATHGALIAHYSAPSIDAADIALLQEIARRTSVAVERAEAHERERKIATTLQQASLPALIAKPEGLTFDTVYTPAGEEAEVGGDWYDAIELDDGSVVVSVGDVTGRGIQAAAIMSKVRHAMGMAPLHEPDPTKILDSAGWFLSKRYPEAIVTAFVAIISPDRRTMRFANAGHPLPILRRDGDLIELQATGLPLGIRQMAKPEGSSEIALREGDIILFFTDGLIEGRREWDIGENVLRTVLRSDLFAASTAPAKLVARSCLPATLHDDVAIMAVSVAPPPSWSLSFDDGRAAWDARSHFVEFLRSNGTSERSVHTAELVFGELLSNVVCHAPGPVEISVECHEETLVLRVIDSGAPIALAEWRLPEDILSERGRGLFIINQLAARVRIEHVANYGNHISVTMPRRS